MALLVISYSRTDQHIVRAVVKLLQTAMRDVIEKAVFWDDDFEPGDSWFEQIKAYIDEAPQLFVFWCDHSSTSAQVKREFQYAFQKQKRVVPVLLDDTPLSPELSPIQGIDVRGAIKHTSTDKAVSFRGDALYNIVFFRHPYIAAALVFLAVFTYLVRFHVLDKALPFPPESSSPFSQENFLQLSSRLEPNTPLLVDAFLQYIPPDPSDQIVILIYAAPSGSDAARFIKQYIKSRRPAVRVHVAVDAHFSDGILLRKGVVEEYGYKGPEPAIRIFPFIILSLIAGVFIVLLFVQLKHRKRRQIIVEAFSEYLASQKPLS